MIMIFYLFVVRCDLFMNKEFENFLNEKRDVSSKSSLVENFTDMFGKTDINKLADDDKDKAKTKDDVGRLVMSHFAPKDQEKPSGGDKKDGKPPGGDKKEGDKKDGKPPGGDKKDGKPPGGDKKEGDKKDGDNDDVSIQQIKIKDKDAVLVKSQKDGDKPTIVVLADESIMQNQEALKQLPEEIGGQGGDNKEEGKSQGGDNKQGKPPGGDNKQGKPPGGDNKQGKPPGGDNKQGKPPGGDAKTPPPGKGSPLVNLNTQENTTESSGSKEKLDLLLGKSKDDNKKDAFWTTVLIDDIPKKVLVNVKTFTVLESMENANGKSKEKNQAKIDKGVMSTFDFNNTKKVDSKKEESNKEEIKKEGEKIKKEVKNKKDESKDKIDDSKDKIEDKKDSKDKKEKKEDSKDKKETSKEKKDGSKEKKDDSKDKKEDKKDSKDKKEDKKEVKKEGNIRYETKEFDKSKSSDNESIWSSIISIGNDSDKDKPNQKRLDGKEKDVKIDSKGVSTTIPVLTKLNQTTTVKMPDQSKKDGKNKADSSVSIDKKDDKDLKKNKENKEKDKENKDKENKEKDKENKEKDKENKEKDKEKEKNKDIKEKESKEKNKNKDNKEKDKENSDNSRKAIESVIFQGADKNMKSLSTSNTTNKTSKKNSEASVDDLLYVLKNMPGKVNINKEGKEIYIEGDFFAPKDKKLGQNSFNFSGVLKSKEGKKN